MSASTDRVCGQVVIRRVSSRHHQILSADGSRVLGFTPTMKQAEYAAAMVNAELARATKFDVIAVKVGGLTEYEVSRAGKSEVVAVIHDADLARTIKSAHDVLAALSDLLEQLDRGIDISTVAAYAALARARGEA